MTLSKDPSLQEEPKQVTDKATDSQPVSPFYLIIQDKAADLIPTRRPFPHLSCNPLSGNSLY